ncbi:hypothetical protein RIF29_40493 [Crotalaria pallida]|uniref:Uncharacterized protein n=1 Tax=Crotalaria pallida TaxID=3830 RepID=A0AAN9E3T2_CROPI
MNTVLRQVEKFPFLSLSIIYIPCLVPFFLYTITFFLLPLFSLPSFLLYWYLSLSLTNYLPLLPSPKVHLGGKGLVHLKREEGERFVSMCFA